MPHSITSRRDYRIEGYLIYDKNQNTVIENRLNQTLAKGQPVDGELNYVFANQTHEDPNLRIAQFRINILSSESVEKDSLQSFFEARAIKSGSGYSIHRCDHGNPTSHGCKELFLAEWDNADRYQLRYSYPDNDDDLTEIPQEF